MFSFLKRINEKFTQFFNDASPRVGELSDNFGLKDQMEKNEVYGDYLDAKQSLGGALMGPFAKLILLIWISGLLYIFSFVVSDLFFS